METRAYLKGTRLSPQKAALVADQIRGKKIDESMIKDAIDKLKISDEDKKALLKLSPSSYTGLAEKLTDLL